MKSSHWYLQGYCHRRNDFRLFRLSRMSNLQMQEETFALRDYQKPTLDVTDILEALQTKIKIRIHKSVMEECSIIAPMKIFHQPVMSITLSAFPS